MKIEVIGCGSVFSKISNTSSILVSDHKQNRMLIDCGPTIPRALWQREIGINDIDAIYFTYIQITALDSPHCLINGRASDV
jgi:ribonuclease Z